MQPEALRPVVVKSPADSRWEYCARLLADLQFATILRFLRPRLADIRGQLLDVGAGESPWCYWLGEHVLYTGLDVESAESFGMSRRPNVVYFDGGRFPFEDCQFDAILCIEVLEHLPRPLEVLREIFRVARPGAQLLLTVPWSARCHHRPNDFHRFTAEGLTALLDSAGFEVVSIAERGSDGSAIANKLLVLNVRLLKNVSPKSIVLSWPLALACLPVTALFLAAHHLATAFGYRGGRDDPLGYAVVAKRPDPEAVGVMNASR